MSTPKNGFFVPFPCSEIYPLSFVLHSFAHRKEQWLAPLLLAAGAAASYTVVFFVFG
jgi:hypothetical protein